MKINSQLKERILNTENKKGEFKIMNDELLKKQLNNIYMDWDINIYRTMFYLQMMR